jgi:hypothetical protein
MIKITIPFIVLLAISSCKGPGSGPLVRNSSDKTEKNQTMMGQTMKSQQGNSNVVTEKLNIVIEPCKDCITISNLLNNKKSFTGKIIRVKGRVTKFNPEIMGKNWVHIQDGSEFNGGFDLTITTDQRVSIGDTLIFEGKIALDKDFGYGYFYNVLMELGKPVL